MRVETRFDGSQLPFEGDQRVVLRALPPNAVVSRAVLTVTPYSLDGDRRFLETITFAGAHGDWGASKRTLPNAVEIDLRARRRLSSLVGSNLSGSRLLVDLGGGFLPVNSNGSLGPPPVSLPSDSPDLPGLTATGLRVAGAGADVSTLRVASPPSNLTVAVQGGPTFLTHVGPAVEAVTSQDFAALLQGMLPELAVKSGYAVVPFVVHSDSIARLQLGVEIEYTVAAPATADGVTTVKASYRFGGMPEDAAPLRLSVPAGLSAAASGTAGRVQGEFVESRVVYGPLTLNAEPIDVPLTADAPLAQPVVLPATQVATSVDLLLTAVTSEATLTVDIVNDLDGKPGRKSLLPRAASLTLSRDEAGAPTWLNVALPGEVEIAGSRRHWVVLQAKEGSAAWGGLPASTPVVGTGDAGVTENPGLQRTRDGSLSWRRVPVAADASGRALLRLRHVTPTFRMPLELRVSSGGVEQPVSLQRFAASGQVDVDLDFDDVGDAVNQVLAAAGGGPGFEGEHVVNGDFVDWYRVGTTVRPTDSLWSGRGLTYGNAMAFHPDGGTLYAVGAAEESMHFVGFSVFCRGVRVESDVGAGTPSALVLDASGRHAVVAAVGVPEQEEAEGASTGGHLAVIDPASGRVVGTPVPTAEPVVDLVRTPDGSGVLLTGPWPNGDDDGATTTLRTVPWTALLAAAAGGALNWADHPFDELAGAPVGLTTSPDGAVFVLTRSDTDGILHRYPSVAAISARGRTSVPTEQDPRGLASSSVAWGPVLVLGKSDLRFVNAGDLAFVSTLPLEESINARALAVDPRGDVAVIIHDEGALVVDLVRRRQVSPAMGGVAWDSLGAWAVASPTGTHIAVTRSGQGHVELLTIGDPLPVDWELTAGVVRPLCLGADEVFAVLGVPRRVRREVVGEVSRREGAEPAAGPSAISQMAPAAAGHRYRFAFGGLTDTEGARAELRWRGAGCTPERVDRVPVSVFEPESRVVLESLPMHEMVVAAPAGITQVEVRFVVPEGAMAVDQVSLAGSANIATSTWEPSAAPVIITGDSGSVVVSNGGSTSAAATQLVDVTAGQRFDLVVRAVPTGPDAAVELAFRDEIGVDVGESVRIDLEQLEFDVRSVSGLIPGGAVVGELRIIVPPGRSVQLPEVGLSVSEPAEVQLSFVSEAPGELTTSGVEVRLDRPPARPAPMPPSGLCPSTPTQPGVGEGDCHCASCGTTAPVRVPHGYRSAAGRPAVVSACPSCGAARVRLGGRVVATAERVDLPQFQTPARSLRRAGHPVAAAWTRVDVPVTEIDGIGDTRARDLRNLGIADLVDLSRASVRVVAAIPGVSDAMAARFIREAAELVRAHGERVVFGEPPSR